MKADFHGAVIPHTGPPLWIQEGDRAIAQPRDGGAGRCGRPTAQGRSAVKIIAVTAPLLVEKLQGQQAQEGGGRRGSRPDARVGRTGPVRGTAERGPDLRTACGGGVPDQDEAVYTPAGRGEALVALAAHTRSVSGGAAGRRAGRPGGNRPALGNAHRLAAPAPAPEARASQGGRRVKHVRHSATSKRARRTNIRQLRGS